MSLSERVLNPAEAARRLGVSAKALRLYEQRGLVRPARSAAGWRAYGPAEMARAAEVVALRGLGLSLAQVARVLGGDPGALAPALAAHQAALEARIRALAGTVAAVGGLRAGLAQGRVPSTGEVAALLAPAGAPIRFDLPWPWGGEPFELPAPQPLTWIIGPLGSGKTRLALRLAEAVPGAVFLGLDRHCAEADPARVAACLAWLVEEGATESPALLALLAALAAEGPAALVVDMVEQGLDEATQLALAAHLRRTARADRPLFLMTRSSAMLDLEAVGPGEAILLCPANHSPPREVLACPGAAGYEAVATCLAPPEVRARTEGVIAWQPRP
ncbi:MerR family transcriptional regulator [Roseomonas sp. F4]